MRSYINVKVRISEGQIERLEKASEWKSDTITIRLKFADLNDEDVIAVIKSQCDRLAKAYNADKGLAIKMSKK